MTLNAIEVDIFIGEHFVVSFHLEPVRELEEVRERILHDSVTQSKSPGFLFYLITDKLVDQYFPVLYQIEEHLNQLEEKTSVKKNQ